MGEGSSDGCEGSSDVNTERMLSGGVRQKPNSILFCLVFLVLCPERARKRENGREKGRGGKYHPRWIPFPAMSLPLARRISDKGSRHELW